MCTPAIENIVKFYRDIEVTIVGSFSSVELLKNHPKVIKTIVIDSRDKLSFKTFNRIGSFDVYFSFRGSMRAKLIKLFVDSKIKYQYSRRKYTERHQVEKYVDFVNYSLNSNFESGNLISYIDIKKKKETSRILGINPGASYGSAKRWYPEKFAKIAVNLSDNFNIMIFGGENEVDFAKKIEDYLVSQNINNFLNLAGKTSITELTNYISSLDVFITGDSGPMHIAASLQIPTIALFGPTNSIETSQWKNSNSLIIQKNLDCQPCMKRTCPLTHHNCMKLIDGQEVIDSIPTISR